MAEQGVITAHDWIRGISFSVLASIIGGASKLSIRKSWLIDARRKMDVYSSGASEANGYRNQNHDSDDSSVDNEAHQLAPMEVDSSPPSPLQPNQHSPLLSCGPNRKHYRKKPSISEKQTSWLLYVSGMIGMSFLNPLCCVLAMKYANPSILAPFSGLTLVWIVLFSGMSVGEHPGRSQKVACALIVAGEVLVALFGDHTNEEEMDVEDVISSYQDPAFRIFITVMTLYLIQLGIFIWYFPKESLLKKIAWGSVGGSITGFQNFLKDALTIFDAHSKQSGNSLSALPSAFYLFVILAMLTSFSGLMCLSACMKRYDATYSSSMFVVSFVLAASCMISIHYHTVEHLDGFINYIMYPLGLATLFLGAYILVKPTSIIVGSVSDGDGTHQLFEEPPCPNSNATCFDERNGHYRRC